MLPATGFNLHHKSLKTAHGAKSYAPCGLSDIIGLEHLILSLTAPAAAAPSRLGPDHASSWLVKLLSGKTVVSGPDLEVV